VAVWLTLGLWIVLVPPLAANQAPSAPIPDRLFRQAVELERGGDLEGALEAYRRLADQHPESPSAPRALLRAARVYHGQRNLVEAQLAAQRLVKDYSTAPPAAGGQVLLAAMKASSSSDPGQLQAVREELRGVAARFDADRYPRLEGRAEARVREGDLGLRLGDLAGAAAAFVGVIEQEPPSRWTARARLGLGHTLLIEERWLEAAGVLQRLVLESANEHQPAYDGAAAGVAQRLLTSIHRLHVRPLVGQPSWTRARRLTIRGVKLGDRSALAVGAGGRLLVADADTVYLAASDGSVTERFTTQAAGRPCWTSRRPLWSDQGSRPCLVGNGRLHCPGDEAAAEFSVGGLRQPRAGAWGTPGRAYVLDGERGGVNVYDASGQVQHALEVRDATDLAVDLQGRAFVLEAKSDRVSRFYPNGARQGPAAAFDWRRPTAVEVDLLGRVYVLDRREKRIDLFDDAGNRLTTLGPLLPGGSIELRRPIDMAIDEQARLYILDAGLEAIVVLE
jgi:tetratricopeptide (TPR) repeat protein